MAYEDLKRRIAASVPRDISGPSDVAEWLGDTGWSDGWTQAQINDFGRDVAGKLGRRTLQETREDRGDRRASPIRQEIDDMKQSIDRFGSDEGGYSAVRAADGTILGAESNVNTWTDAHGNLMGKKEGEPMTKAKKILDSEER